MKVKRKGPNLRMLIQRNGRLIVVFGIILIYLLIVVVFSQNGSSLDQQHMRTNEDLPDVDKVKVNENTKLYQQKVTNVRQDRIYCMVPTMYRIDRIKLWDAILKTWGRDCDVLKFMIDPVENEDVPETYSIPDCNVVAHVVVIPMVRKNGGLCSDGKPCRHIWEKVWRSWVYVGDNDLDTAEWFLKVDDDSYLIASNLRKYVREHNWNPDDTHYFGHKVFMPGGVNFISGTLTAFSRATIRAMGPVYKSMPHEYGDRSKFKHGRCVDRDGATEEKTTSICLKSVGIEAEDVSDKDGREYVLPLGIPFTVIYKRKPTSKSWYWQGKPLSRGDKERCCSFSAWGIHGYKSSKRLLEMQQMMEGWTLVSLKEKMQHLPKDNDEYWHLWYIRELRLAILKDLPNKIARGDFIPPVYYAEFDKYV